MTGSMKHGGQVSEGKVAGCNPQRSWVRIPKAKVVGLNSQRLGVRTPEGCW